MPNKDNMSLNDVMGKPTTNSTHIDLTRGGVNTSETAEQPQKPVARRARPVVTGPIDFATMKDADIDKILPPREPKPSDMEMNLMADLDMAIEREKVKISDRQDQILAAQDREMEEAELAHENLDEDFEDEDSSDVASTNAHFRNTNTVDDYYDEDEEDDYYDEPVSTNFNTHADAVKVNVDTNSASLEASKNVTAEIAKETVMTDPPQVVEREIPRAAIPTNKVEVKVEEPVKEESEEDFDFIKELGLEDDEEVESVEENQETDESAEKILENIKTQVKERVDTVRKSIDLSKFTISKKAVSAQKVMKMAVRAHQTVADWMLYTANKPISVSGLSGSEILKLNPENTTRNRLNTFKDIYRIIFDHVIDANKPDFETWLKQTNFVDLQHIYFALYMATFGNSNFVNLECPKCKKIFIKDFKIEEMIEYANEEARAKVREILRNDTTTHKNDEYDVDIVQISNTYAFAVKTPSIWNVIIETASLSDKVLERYADLIDVVSYIDSIYIINESTSELVPIDYKIDPNDQAKTAARRVKAFYDVISSLSSEDYYHLRNVISNYDKSSNDVSYIIPATTCPDCRAEIPANKDITADGLVFTRHQLAAIGNM